LVKKYQEKINNIKEEFDNQIKQLDKGHKKYNNEILTLTKKLKITNKEVSVKDKIINEKYEEIIN
jgi:hypothetical protein